MTLTFPTIGQTPWGAPLNALIGQATSTGLPDDHGMLAWSFHPSGISSQGVLTSGVLHLTRVQVRRAATISNVVAGITVVPVTPVAGQNFGALYDSTGARIGVTADQTAAWNSVGSKVMALTAPVAVVQGFYWVALLANAATTPQFARTFPNASALNNLGSTAATSFSGTSGAAQTVTPVSFVPAAITPNTGTFWAAVS